MSRARLRAARIREIAARVGEDKPVHVTAAITVRRDRDELCASWRDFWDAEITEDVPGERISWRSMERSRIEKSGTVVFAKAPGDQGTEVHVELRYDVPGGAVGATLAKLFGAQRRMQVKDDLRRFKQIAETGEIAHSDGSPEGQLGTRQPKQRPAHPLGESEPQTIGIGVRS